MRPGKTLYFLTYPDCRACVDFFCNGECATLAQFQAECVAKCANGSRVLLAHGQDAHSLNFAWAAFGRFGWNHPALDRELPQAGTPVSRESLVQIMVRDWKLGRGILVVLLSQAALAMLGCQDAEPGRRYEATWTGKEFRF